MFCTQCGAKLDDGTKFCTSCGAPVTSEDVPAETEVFAAPLEDEYVPENSYEGFTEVIPENPSVNVDESIPENEPLKKKGKAPVIIGAVAASLVCICAVVGVLFWQGIIPNPFAEKTKQVQLKFVTPKYNADTDSKIPLKIAGKTSHNNDFDEIFYVSPNDPQIEVPEGNYDVSLAASPLLSTGDMYKLAEPVKLDVTNSNTTNEAALEVTFEIKPIGEITHEDIAAAKEAAEASGYDESLKEAAVSASTNKQTAGQFSNILDKFVSEHKSDTNMYTLHDVNGDSKPDLIVATVRDNVQHYAIWTAGADGSDPKEISVPENLTTMYQYVSSFRDSLQGSYEGNGLLHTTWVSSNAAEITAQRYVIENDSLVEGEKINIVDLRNEAYNLDFINVNDRSLLENYDPARMAEEVEAAKAQKAANRDQAIATAKSEGRYVLSGTVKVVSGLEAGQMSRDVGLLSQSELDYFKKEKSYASMLNQTYTLFVLDEPQELGWISMTNRSQPSSNGRKTYFIDLRSSLNAAYSGAHLTISFDGTKGGWPSEATVLGMTPTGGDPQVIL